MRIDREAFYNAAHACYCSIEADRAEECGESYSGMELTECIEQQPDNVLFGPMFAMLQEIQRAWGESVADVMAAGHVTEAESQEDFLFLLVMGCLGHGIGLWDGRFDGEMDDARAALGRELDAAPLYTETVYEWLDAAYERWPETSTESLP